jgi:hypothetical protein
MKFDFWMIHVVFKFYRFLFGFLIFVFSQRANAQKEVLNLDEFNFFKSGNQVFVRFSISAGNTCEGIRIWRATRSDSFQIIHEIPGICGSDSVSLLYVEEDKNPVFNQPVLYKLQFGTFGFSDTLSGFLVNTRGNGHLSIRKNDDIYLFFENPTQTEMNLKLYEPGGKVISESYTQSESFVFRSKNLPKGIVYFLIRNSKSGISSLGKWLIP